MHAESSASEITDLIGQEMRKKNLCDEVIASVAKISVFIDKSTIVALKSGLIVYICTVIHSKAVQFFLDLI